MGHWVSLVCAAVLLLLHQGREATCLDITATSSTVNLLTGDNINLTISYNSTKSGTVKWAFNGITIVIWTAGVPQVSDSYKNRLTIVGNGSLVISNTSKADSGNYSVTVLIVGEQDGFRQFQVAFYDPVKDVKVFQSPDAVNEGTTAVNLTCNATSGIVNVMWTKDGHSVGYNDNYVLLNGNQTLQINHPNRTNTGIYLCNISNPVTWNDASYMLNVSYSDSPASLSAGAIAGIVIGSVLGALLLIGLIVLLVLCIRKRKIDKSTNQLTKEKKLNGPHHKEAIRTISGTTLSPDDPAFFTLNNIMYRNSSISMGSYIMNFNDYKSENNNSPSPNPASTPTKVKHATQV